MNDERRHTTLTDDDVEKIVKGLESRLLGHFYLNIGKGVWSLLWKGVIIGLLILAAWGKFGGKSM